MAGLVNELVDVLNSQSEVYERLLEMSLEKRRAIIKNDTDALKGITSSENTLIGKSQRLEKKRLEIVADIANVLNADKDKITLSYLSEALREQPEHTILDTAAERIRKVLDALKAANQTNKLLIENSLEYIEFNINVMQSTFSDEPTVYSAKGEELSGGRSFLDSRN